MIPDVFVLGIVGERLTAQLTEAGPDHDLHQRQDVTIHLNAADQHKNGFQLAVARGDFYAAFIEQADTAINIFFAWIVASRIVDPATRQAAFQEINERGLQSG